MRMIADVAMQSMNARRIHNVYSGHDQLLKIRQLKKSGQHNFSTAQHYSSKFHFFVNWSNPVNLWGSTGFEQFHFQSKNINCSNCNWSTKVLENVKCSTQFIVKKMVYMYGSQVRGQVRLRYVRCTCMAVRLGVRLGQVRLGVHVWQLGQVYMYGSQVRCQVRIGQARLGQDRIGQVRLGQVRIGQVRLGQDRIGQVRSLTCTADKLLTISI